MLLRLLDHMHMYMRVMSYIVALRRLRMSFERFLVILGAGGGTGHFGRASCQKLFLMEDEILTTVWVSYFVLFGAVFVFENRTIQFLAALGLFPPKRVSSCTLQYFAHNPKLKVSGVAGLGWFLVVALRVGLISLRYSRCNITFYTL